LIVFASFLPLSMLPNEMWLVIILGYLFRKSTEQRLVAPTTKPRPNFTPVCTWLYSTKTNSPGQKLLSEKWVLHAWKPWEGSKESSN
jgi:hypothetical protein